MTPTDKEIILAYADCDMSRNKTAKRVYLDPNTVYYHFRRIEQETGLNPRRFYDLIKLVEMVKGDGPHERLATNSGL